MTFTSLLYNCCILERLQKHIWKSFIWSHWMEAMSSGLALLWFGKQSKTKRERKKNPNTCGICQVVLQTVPKSSVWELTKETQPDIPMDVEGSFLGKRSSLIGSNDLSRASALRAPRQLFAILGLIDTMWGLHRWAASIKPQTKEVNMVDCSARVSFLRCPPAFSMCRALQLANEQCCLLWLSPFRHLNRIYSAHWSLAVCTPSFFDLLQLKPEHVLWI